MTPLINQQASPLAIAVASRTSTTSLPEQHLFAVREVASYLSISTSSVWRHVQRKNLPAPIRIGGSTRWRKVDLEAFLEAAKAQRPTATSAEGGVE